MSRVLYGRIQRNPESEFIDEIDDSLLDYDNVASERIPFAKERAGYVQRAAAATTYRPTRHHYASAGKRVAPKTNEGTGADKQAWSAGDKVRHKKWGVGTVVSVNGTGKDMELDIAFPNEGVRRLLATFAPIEKVDD